MLSAFLKKLLFARQFQLDAGKIEVLGVRQAMLPLESVIALGVESKKAELIIRDGVESCMESYARKIGATTEGKLRLVQEIFATFGLGRVEIISLIRIYLK